MKQTTRLFVVFALALPLAVAAQTVVDPLPVGDFLREALNFLKSLKGTTPLAIVAAFVQLTIVFFRTPFGNFAGIWKLVVVTALSVVYALVSGLLQGHGFIDSILSGGSISAWSVLINEVLKHFKQMRVAQKEEA